MTSYSPLFIPRFIPSIRREPHRTKRPHTKSRYGCFSCKARRVKCQETRPNPCANCISRNTLCIYPSEEQVLHRRGHSSSHGSHRSRIVGSRHGSSARRSTTPPALESAVTLSSQQNVSHHAFAADDLRFLQHFLIVAYPHLPFGSEDLWKTCLPASAHECPHLMHAILCLGATHLSLVTPDGGRYTTLAVTHRGQALRMLGDALIKGDQCSRTELELMLATAYALTFQANYMEDGLVDFAVMVRGCSIITRRILNKYDGSEMFKLLKPDVIYRDIVLRIPLTHCADTDFLDTSIETLKMIEPLLVSDSHRNAYGALLNTYNAFKSSAREAFIAFTGFYNHWEGMGNREFMEFLEPTNYVSRALFLHYIAITVLFRPVFQIFKGPRAVVFPRDELPILQWGAHIYQCLPPSVRGLVEWQANFITLDQATLEGPNSGQAILEPV
ncbi:hypothetical protein BDV23DRAFT_169163 [Aspergillus alliaceus]|uniref:Zn(2)-C6 fungal-type domain-containing protein n=1 Tax=Petromyces alliaceus TaxID=209559 RepID=A0A5N7CLZ9_PETAA|nr:hypothetical protein BDV23DRAFT_169163 [Aspergillus alliaceus]